MSFLQTCSWFRRFIPNFAEVAKPLSNLTKKKVNWIWGKPEKDAFETLFMHSDASKYALGAVLLQGEGENQHPIEYASRLLLKAEQNYSTTERKALAVVWALQKFRG